MSKYDPELVGHIIKYIETGNTVTTACQAVGINRDTYYEWLKDETKPDITDVIIQKAEAKAIIRNLLIIQAAATKNWQAAAWFLERKDHKNWGRKELLGGIETEPIKVVIEHVAKKNTGDKGL